MNKKMNIGIVGCGTIADIHAQAILESKNAVLHSVYSRNEENLQKCMGKYGVKGFSNWNRFITDPGLNAVSVCTPSGNHLDFGIKAAEAGKHVIVEKPIEVTLQRARALMKKCKESKVKLAVIFQNRYIPEIARLKEALEQKVIGDIFLGDAVIKWYRSQDYYKKGGWHGTLKLDGGGALINQAIHTIDLLQWFMGEVDLVFGQTGTFNHVNMEGEDTAVAVLRFKSGAVGVIEGATSVHPAQPRKIELHGKKGSVKIIDDEVSILIGSEKLETKSRKGKSKGADSPLDGFSIEPHKNQFEAIAEAILKGKDPPLSGEEALKSLAIVLAVYESGKSSVPVSMDTFMTRII